MALKGRDKLLITFPADFDPDFVRKLDGRLASTQWLRKRIAELEAYYIGSGEADPIRSEAIHSVACDELIRRTYQWKLTQGEQIDLGGLTHIGTTILAAHKELRNGRLPAPANNLDAWKARQLRSVPGGAA